MPRRPAAYPAGYREQIIALARAGRRAKELPKEFAPSDQTIVTWAARRVPIALFIGSRDQLHTVDHSRRTRDLLRGRGFPVHNVELGGQNHALAPVAVRVLPQA